MNWHDNIKFSSHNVVGNTYTMPTNFIQMLTMSVCIRLWSFSRCLNSGFDWS